MTSFTEWFKSTLKEANKQSDAKEQALIQQHNQERIERRYRKLTLDIEKEGLFIFKKGVLTQNPAISPEEWHFYYDVAQSNITYAVLEASC